LVAIRNTHWSRTGQRFEWDSGKAASNRRKHGVSFEEASTVLDDPHVLFVADWDHGEPRVNLIGVSAEGRVLFVVNVEMDEDCVRIVSARKCTPKERRLYEEGE
jgi:uncharacterized DUF497 family protein